MTCNHFYLLHQTEAECTDGRVFTAPVPLYTHSISGVHTAHGFGTTKLVDINGWSWWFNTTIFYSGSKHLTFTVKSRRKIGGLSFSNSRHLGMYTGREFWFQLRSTGWLMGSNSIEILGTSSHCFVVGHFCLQKLKNRGYHLIDSVSCTSLFEHLSRVSRDQDWQMIFWWSWSDFFSPTSSVISGWCQCHGPGTDGVSSPAPQNPVTPSQNCHPSVTAWSQRRWLSWLGLTLSLMSVFESTTDHFTGTRVWQYLYKVKNSCLWKMIKTRIDLKSIGYNRDKL